MIIKKFVGKTELEAVELAKKELGETVVIMNVKAIKPKGLFAFLKSTTYEVTVAKEEESESAQPPAKNITEALSQVDSLRIKAENEGKMPSPTPKSTGNSEALEKLDNIQTLLEEKLKKPEEDKPAPSVKAETEPKKIAPVVNKEEPPKRIMDFIKLLYNTMVDNEVNQAYANQMIDEIEKNYSNEMEMEYILSHIYQKMILKFGKAETITPSTKKGPKIIFFIGPTGVGKTTTLAKIASLLTVMDNKKVAMFTADTYRIAATDQLKMYATIMGTPFHIIYDTEQMLENYEKYKNYDYILVDTAGHSHHNEEQKKNMAQFISAFDGKCETEVYLVLSATTKYKDLISIADTYSSITDYKLIFTKLDETDSYGNLLNVKMHTGAPMSYVTCGQNVPDDIDKFDPQDTVRKLLGGNA